MNQGHTFHIPVMGTAFSIDTPLKVARFGISSVISLVDDHLIEQVRQFYCKRLGEIYIPITKNDEDFRARRITEYLNMVDRIVKRQFEDLKNSAFDIGTEITQYFELLPNGSPLKILYNKMLQTSDTKEKLSLQEKLRSLIRPGDIQVNIMTKLDRPNFTKNDEPLPEEFSDALAALRGYAQSSLHSAIVMSAGINRRLYSYAAQFKDFYADKTGNIKKRIIIKVSDYRSAFTQGKFFAKKGLWVSEYRIESGLNCGGHVFPAAGELMGPILEEFKTKRKELIETLHQMVSEALKSKKQEAPSEPLALSITAQGGIGTAKEHQFLLEEYQIDSCGWGTPWLLVPEVTNVDEPTLQKLSKATEDDLFISNVSPVGVPFNNLRTSPSELEKQRKIASGKPGSACPRGHLVSNTEFTKIPICTASRLYQKLKIDQLNTLNLEANVYERTYQNIVKKSCICNDLGESFFIKNDVFDLRRQLFPAVCPGPNIAYFSKIATFKEMVDHIYGRMNLLTSSNRPHMFIKELKINVEFLAAEIKEMLPTLSTKDLAYVNEFKTNLHKGIEYYKELIPKMVIETKDFRNKMIQELGVLKENLNELISAYVPSLSQENSLTIDSSEKPNKESSDKNPSALAFKN